MPPLDKISWKLKCSKEEKKMKEKHDHIQVLILLNRPTGLIQSLSCYVRKSFVIAIAINIAIAIAIAIVTAETSLSGGLETSCQRACCLYCPIFLDTFGFFAVSLIFFI